ncbi:MAG: DUF1566 domain-containing protein [Desulfobacteraceae bacterium]|jgi:serine/threonine-protein kinase
MKKIGRYTIQGLLGRGGMGRVFKVELPAIGKFAALKLLDPDPLILKLMGLEKLRAAFIREAATIASLNHPNIVTVHDFDEHDGKPFFVMDFFANNLGTLIGESYTIEKPSRSIPIDRALNYIQQTLDGLDCLHDAGILHCDIKPFNLLITAQDTIKICDFGLSKLRNEAYTGPASLNVGSPYYAAPEQEKDPDNVDLRADLYPVGIMFYRMVTCHLPYLNDTNEGYIPPSRFNPDLDSQWDDFMQKAVDRSPDRRFNSAASMKSALIDLSLHWEKQKEKTCAFDPSRLDTPMPVSRSLHYVPRHTPLKLRPKSARVRFNLDSLWQPKAYMANQFEKHGQESVKDHSTGLIWQTSGSRYPRYWQSAQHYIRQLNQEKFSGIDNWRLPNIDELVTLLNPNPQGAALCIESVFDDTQRWLWSIDRRSFTAAYYVDIELGFVGWQDFSAPYYVRAVSQGV